MDEVVGCSCGDQHDIFEGKMIGYSPASAVATVSDPAMTSIFACPVRYAKLKSSSLFLMI